MWAFSFVNSTKGGLFFMLTGSQNRRRVLTAEQREAYNAYQRDYRRRNPDKARLWQQNYILRKAARLAAEQAQAEQTTAE